MGVLDALLPSRATIGLQADLAARHTPVALAAAPAAMPDRASQIIGDARAQRLNRNVGMQVPAVRRAVHVIAGTISTFALSAWQGGRRLPPGTGAGTEPAWLRQPDTGRTLAQTMAGTIRDAIWTDRSYWRITDRYMGTGAPAAFRRIQPSRVSVITDPQDSDLITDVIVDGASVPLSQLVIFDWGGVGGLERFGWDLLSLYLDLQSAAAGYARAPHPKAILRNSGGDLTDLEIEQLLASWEAARGMRSVGYLNDVVEYQTFGWTASELQLTEAREHAALETARLFGLPARTLDAAGGGSSITYANVTESRVDLLEALRPWMAPVEQTLSMTAGPGRAGAYVVRDMSVRFDVDAYTRDAPATRMATWAQAIASGTLTVDEVRRWEPLASEGDT